MDFREFESRKKDHLRLALNAENEASGGSGLETIRLRHRALPELNFSDITLAQNFWGYAAASPFFISSMTAGHKEGEKLNRILAKVAGEKKWPMGIGSQRRELSDPEAVQVSKELRKQAPKTNFFSNIGLAQLIQSPVAQMERLVDSLEASAIIVHCNALQEVLQREGTPHFAGGIKAIGNLCKKIAVPVIVKETGCGFSQEDFSALATVGIAALDVSGYGGTHWGRIEGERAELGTAQEKAAKTFAFWGEPTVDSLCSAVDWAKNASAFALWASGGIRSGLDGAKCIALGAEKVGFAKPALISAQASEESLAEWMNQMEFELKVALFCTASKDPDALRKGSKWQKI